MAEDLEKKTAECEELKRVGVFLFFFLYKKFLGGYFGVFFKIYIPISDGPVYKKKSLFLECMVMFTECSQNQRIDNAWWPHLFYIPWMSAFMVLVFCFVWIYRFCGFADDCVWWQTTSACYLFCVNLQTAGMGWACMISNQHLHFILLCAGLQKMTGKIMYDVQLASARHFVLCGFAEDDWDDHVLCPASICTSCHFVLCWFAEDDWDDHVLCPASICTSCHFVLQVCRRWLGWPCIVSS